MPFWLHSEHISCVRHSVIQFPAISTWEHSKFWSYKGLRSIVILISPSIKHQKDGDKSPNGGQTSLRSGDLKRGAFWFPYHPEGGISIKKWRRLYVGSMTCFPHSKVVDICNVREYRYGMLSYAQLNHRNRYSIHSTPLSQAAWKTRPLVRDWTTTMAAANDGFRILFVHSRRRTGSQIRHQKVLNGTL